MSPLFDTLKLTLRLTTHDERLEIRAAAPGGEGRAEAVVPDRILLDRLAEHDPTNIPSSTLESVGKALYQCLMIGDVAKLASDVLQNGMRLRQPVQFELRFDVDQVPLAQYPWEMIADDRGRFLVRDGLVDVTRYIAYPQPPATFKAELHDMPLLRVVSQPPKLPPINVIELIMERIETLRHATFEQFMRKLLIERMAFWGLQFEGHGALILRCRKCDAANALDAGNCHMCNASLSDAKQVSVLAFERNGDVDWIPIGEFGSVLYNARVQLALLLACETTCVGDRLVFSGLAPGLILAGVPAVVGMQYPVPHDFVNSFSNSFYKALLDQNDILDALRTARRMIWRAWYSPALYLRHRKTAGEDEPIESVYRTRNIDTAAPAEVRAGVEFLVRLWIRRPETKPLTQKQLREELGVSESVSISMHEAEADVKFEPVEDVKFELVERRKLRRGEVEVKLSSPYCDVIPERIKLFVDEHLDAPPAIFTVRARKLGRAPLLFSVWQDGGQIISITHHIQVLDSNNQARTIIETISRTVPVQDILAEVLWRQEPTECLPGELQVKAMAQVFLSYVREDRQKVESLYQKLSDAGFKPWMDKKDILPGEDWKFCIQKAIQRSDFFLVCLSANSVSKRGFLQKEIKDALDIWQERLESDIYLIPARLEDCEVPESLRRFQWVNLFEEEGWTRLVKAIKEGMKRRAPVTQPAVQESTPPEPYPTDEEPSPSTEMATPEEGPERERSEKLTLSEESRMQNTLKELYEQGLRHFQNAEWQQAIDSFLAVLRLDVDYENAFAMLKQAQKEEKLENLYNKGDTYLQQGVWRNAVEVFKEIQGINPGYRDIKKKLREAEKKEHIRTLYEQGKEYLANEEWQKAIDNLRAVQRQDPSYPNVAEGLRKAEKQKRLQDLYHRGIEYYRQEKWSNAIEMFSELQKTAHNYPDVAAKLEQAEVQQQTERNLRDLYDKAMGYQEAGDWQDAINAYVDILRIDPEYEDITERLSKINRLRRPSPIGKSQKARSAVSRWWASLTTDGKAQVVLGVLAIIVAVVFGIFSIPSVSSWWSSVISSNTPTVASTEVPIPTNTSPSTLTITITPTSTPSPTNTPLPPYPTPALVRPDKGTSFAKGQDVKLEWKWERDLEEDEFFDVRIRLEGEQEFGKMNRTKASYQFVPVSRLTHAGTYEWQVAIVSRLGEERVVSQVWSFVVQ